MRWIGAAVGLLFASVTALAASQPATPPLPPIPPPAPSEPAAPEAPPYQARLERLAELLGTLTFMQDLCSPGDGASWRAKMTELMGAEGSTDERRDRLAGAFNRGFDSYRVTYRRCTPAAREVIARSLAEGSRLARDLSARFGS